MQNPAKLPRGVKAVEWKNAAGGPTSTRYRVRVVRAAEGFKLDRLVHTMGDALTLLAEAGTPDGRKRITLGRDAITLRDQRHDIKSQAAVAADAATRRAVEQATAREVIELDGPPKPRSEPPSPVDALRDQLMQSVAASMLLKAANGKLTTLGIVVERYIKANLDELASPASIGKVRENLRNSAKLMKIRLENAMRTPMLYLPPHKQPAEPLVGEVALAYESKHATRQTLGDWKLVELDAEVGEGYIRQRLKPYTDAKGNSKTRSPLTIKREIVDINKVIFDLAESDRGMWKVIGGENRFAACARSIKRGKRSTAKSDGAKRWRRIGAAEERELLDMLTFADVHLRRTADEIARGVVKTVRRKRNPEMALIFRLSLATGLRVGECVLLEWADIDRENNSIMLSDIAAKRGERRPMLTREAHQILSELREFQKAKKMTGPRLFSYTVQGFKGLFRRLRNERGIVDLVWHDLRRTAIARIWEKIPGAKPVEIAQWFGAQDVTHFEENMLVPIKQALGNARGEFIDERHARQSVGHASQDMTAHYAYFDQGRSKTAGPAPMRWTMGGSAPLAVIPQPLRVSVAEPPPPAKESK